MLTSYDLRNIRAQAGNQTSFSADTVLQLLDAIAQARSDGYRAGQREMRRRAVSLCHNPTGLTDDSFRRLSQAWNDDVLEVGAALRRLLIESEAQAKEAFS